MADTAARMLALLGMLQARSDWSGAELAQRLGVTDRTIRNDIDRLRGLGYPVDAVRGPGGRYRLGAGTKLPPLLLEEDEAVAVAVGLSASSAVQGIEETSVRALTKLEHVLPHRLQRRVNALRSAVSAGPRTPAPTSRTRSSTRLCCRRWRPRSATTRSCASTTATRHGTRSSPTAW